LIRHECLSEPSVQNKQAPEKSYSLLLSIKVNGEIEIWEVEMNTQQANVLYSKLS